MHPETDGKTGKAKTLPRCPKCNLLARPNVCFFSDLYWQPVRTREQHKHYEAFLERANKKNMVILEIGAGTAISTIRIWASRNVVAHAGDVSFVRINLEDSSIADVDFPNSTNISFSDTALNALSQIETAMNNC